MEDKIEDAERAAYLADEMEWLGLWAKSQTKKSREGHNKQRGFHIRLWRDNLYGGESFEMVISEDTVRKLVLDRYEEDARELASLDFCVDEYEIMALEELREMLAHREET
jgi:hypothetical protein